MPVSNTRISARMLHDIMLIQYSTNKRRTDFLPQYLFLNLEEGSVRKKIDDLFLKAMSSFVLFSIPMLNCCQPVPNK